MIETKSLVDSVPHQICWIEQAYLLHAFQRAWAILGTVVVDYHRLVLALNADELELFVRAWANHKKSDYHSVEGFGGPGDRGRDVVGFASSLLHEGEWDNHQCKQYASTLPTAKAYHDIGKVLYYASQGEFTPPRTFIFVAPRGVNRNLLRSLFKPTEFKAGFIANWTAYCETTIVDGQKIPLTGAVLETVEAYDFSRIKRLTLAEMLDDPAAVPVLHKWFGADPGEAPSGSAPEALQDLELPYIGQLINAYSDRSGRTVSDYDAAIAHTDFGPHLALQRERFFDADAFKRFYRDNTDATVIEGLERDIFHGVVDVCGADHRDSLARVQAVMMQAANVQPSGILAKHSRVMAKQGICHHFANEPMPRLRWCKP